MKPDRSNYEIWIIDWLDGNLGDQEIKLLQEFLDSNPDLREEAATLLRSPLLPGDRSFPNKNLLRRNPSDLHSAQFEYLAVGYLEDDLSSGQLAELNECMEKDEEKRKVFETIQKLKLTPPQIRYMNKGKLVRRTVGGAIYRWSFIGLSIAAGIALLILSYVFIPRYITEKNNNAVSDALPGPATGVPDEMLIYKPDAIAETLIPDETIKPEIQAIPSVEAAVTEPGDQAVLAAAADEHGMTREISGSAALKIDFLPELSLNIEKPDYTLIASNNTFIVPVFDYGEDRSRFSRFIARTFREKILKTEPYNESPLKSYEIAEAGIKGLNLLFGTKMALRKTYDDTGELQSIYFSSKYLKFNAPVKKSAPAE